jgi:hypothetical protein
VYKTLREWLLLTTVTPLPTYLKFQTKNISNLHSIALIFNESSFYKKFKSEEVIQSFTNRKFLSKKDIVRKGCCAKKKDCVSH